MYTANYTAVCGAEEQPFPLPLFYQHCRRENTTAAATPLSLPQLYQANAPIEPFTGYAAVLNRSGFVEPARQLLEEICQFGRGDFAACRDNPDAFILEGELDKFDSDDGQQYYCKKIKLVSMLDEVYKNYRLYNQHVEAVIASFETVAGLSSAVPYVSMALMFMSRSFRSLKNVIFSNLIQLNKVSGKGPGKREISGFGLARSTVDEACPQRGTYGSITFGRPHVWRPQRGLPEHAVGVLKAWLFEHFLHPYPTDNDKQLLAKQTGLTRNQVSNWFINARVRLWKPMVEEIHNLELLQLQKPATADNNVRDTDFQILHTSSSAATSSSNRPAESVSAQINYNQNRLNKSSNIEFPHIEEPYYFVFNDNIRHGQAVGSNSAVSLTLGLHQNDGRVCMPEPLSTNVARHFGLEECNNCYVLGAFEGQEIRQHGRESGRSMLHDFVG